jgi:lysine biosynthesis protein LysW
MRIVLVDDIVIIGTRPESARSLALGECMATCPECDAEIEISADDLEEMEEGDPWDCEACGSRLRVATLDPLEFDTDEEAEDEDEDAEKKTGEAEEEAELEEDDDDDEETEDWDE